MTIHFSQFDDKPPALDDRERTPAEKARLEELEKLTGSQISQAIEAECDDPDCPNAKSTGPGAAAGKNAKDAAAGQGKGTQASDESLASGIFHTESNLRCVL